MLRVIALVTTEFTCLRWLLEDFGVYVSMLTHLLSDTISAISIARDPIKHELTKHIGANVYYTRAHVQDGVIALQYVLFRAPTGRFLHDGSNLHPPSILSLQTKCS
jgi:hypothetical protein